MAFFSTASPTITVLSNAQGVADPGDFYASGVVGAYDVAWCLAAAMVGRNVPRGGAWTLDFPGIDDARYDKRWVARFVSAYVNRDIPTGEALFSAAIADGQLGDCLLALAGSTVATLKHRAA